MIRRALVWAAAAAFAGVAAGAAPQGVAPTICDALAAKLRPRMDGPTSTGSAFAALTGGVSPTIQIATPDAAGKDVSLGRNPAADTRIQFEKRFRAEFGETPALVRELRNWEAFDVVTLPGSHVHMVVSTGGADLCESRIFFRTNSIRESERLPDPPAGPENTVCQNLGGWGYLARINTNINVNAGATNTGTEAYVEYRVAHGRESFRIVPLADDGWQAACMFTAPYKPSSRPSSDRFRTRP
jgi:hypothetical protein